MSQQMPLSSSIEAMTDYAVGVEAGLAVPIGGHADLAPGWETRIDGLQQARTERETIRHRWIRAIAVCRAWDLVWDDVVGKVSSESYHASGKNADAAPYVHLFGTMKAEEAKSLGPAKAIVFGATLAKKLDTVNDPALAGLADELRAANVGLQAAAEAKVAAYDNVLMQGIKRVHLVNELNTAIAVTEAAILTRHPGDHARVRALLSPQKKEERGPSEPTDGDPVVDGGTPVT